MNTSRTDAVDVIVHDWTEARGDLDFSALGVFSRVKRIAQQLNVVRKRAFAAAGLELWEFDVLSALRRSGTPHALTPKVLMASNLVSSGTMTNRIDRLTERGLVVREADPNDGRSVLVRMTETGRERVDEAITRLVAAEDALLQELTPADAVALEHGLRGLALRMEPQTADASAVEPVERSESSASA